MLPFSQDDSDLEEGKLYLRQAAVQDELYRRPSFIAAPLYRRLLKLGMALNTYIYP